MGIEDPTVNKNSEKYGVQEVKNEKQYCIVSIVWKNGEKSEMHFPEKGFNIVDIKTKQNLGFMSAEDAISVLREHSSKYNREDFSWTLFVNE